VVNLSAVFRTRISERKAILKTAVNCVYQLLVLKEERPAE
jgi:hypothetical protein